MDRKKKIIVAITAAIAKYLEEEAAALQMAMQPYYQQPVVTQQTPTPTISAWALSGRLSTMERRFNMQYRFNR